MHIKTKSIKDKGFTIVELLVVIVVIGILAAITIVSYGGVTVRANNSSSQNAANAVNKKSNVYATEATTTGKYPVTLATLTGSSVALTYHLDGVTYDAMGTVTTNSAIPPASPTAPASKSSILYAICGVRTTGTNTAPTQASEIATVTGNKIYYWDWSASAITTTPTTNGILSGTVGPQTVGCFPAGS